jgi:hypothetical protein
MGSRQAVATRLNPLPEGKKRVSNGLEASLDPLTSILSPRGEEANAKSNVIKQNGEEAFGLLPACFTSYRLGACAPDDQAARLAFAFSAIAPNALMSCTAMSASTLRSTVMPALARPLIRRL